MFFKYLQLSNQYKQTTVFIYLANKYQTDKKDLELYYGAFNQWALLKFK